MKLIKMQLERINNSLNAIRAEKIKKADRNDAPTNPAFKMAIAEAKRHTTVFAEMVLEQSKHSSYVDVNDILRNMPEYHKKCVEYTEQQKKHTAKIEETKAKLNTEISRIMDMLYLGQGDPLKLIDGFKKFNA